MTKSKETLEMNMARTTEFVRNKELENILKTLNAGIEGIASSHYSTPKYPVIIIVGNARSGTTLALQWLASTKYFSYPSNILARFYGNPFFGALVQKALIDEDLEGQIGFPKTFDFTSKLGKTGGALAPSEFWYFWRRFFEFGELQQLDDDTLQKTDTGPFLRGLAGIEAAFDKPLVLKGMIMNWHIPFLDKILDKVIFLNMERDRFFTAQSLYGARNRFFGDTKKWYSFKPAEYSQLASRPPLEQIAGQIHFTNKAVRTGLNKVSENRKLTVSYEELCKSPRTIYKNIQEKLVLQGCEISDIAPENAQPFPVSKEIHLDQTDITAVNDAFKAYASQKP